jgi:hypothetical protein
VRKKKRKKHRKGKSVRPSPFGIAVVREKTNLTMKMMVVEDEKEE